MSISQHARFGQFTRVDQSTRHVWEGSWKDLALTLDSLAALSLLERLPRRFEPWLERIVADVAADLVQHGNPRWSGLDSRELARSLRLVAITAISETERLSLLFEEGLPARCDITADIQLTRKFLFWKHQLKFVGYTNRDLEQNTDGGTVIESFEVPGLGLTKRIEEPGGYVVFKCERDGVSISFESREQIDSVAKVYDALPTWRADAARHAAEQLTPTWNECWLDDDEAESTPAQFAARLVLTEITCYEDGEIDFSFDDSEDRLGGHIVCISWSEDDWSEAEIAG